MAGCALWRVASATLLRPPSFAHPKTVTQLLSEGAQLHGRISQVGSGSDQQSQTTHPWDGTTETHSATPKLECWSWN